MFWRSDVWQTLFTYTLPRDVVRLVASFAVPIPLGRLVQTLHLQVRSGWEARCLVVDGEELWVASIDGVQVFSRHDGRLLRHFSSTRAWNLALAPKFVVVTGANTNLYDRETGQVSLLCATEGKGVCAHDGEVYVAHWDDEEVAVFHADTGQLQRRWGRGRGRGRNQRSNPNFAPVVLQVCPPLTSPKAVCMVGSEVMVTDYLQRCVLVFDVQGGCCVGGARRGTVRVSFWTPSPWPSWKMTTLPSWTASAETCKCLTATAVSCAVGRSAATATMLWLPEVNCWGGGCTGPTAACIASGPPTTPSWRLNEWGTLLCYATC